MVALPLYWVVSVELEAENCGEHVMGRDMIPRRLFLHCQVRTHRYCNDAVLSLAKAGCTSLYPLDWQALECCSDLTVQVDLGVLVGIQDSNYSSSVSTAL